MMNEQTPDNLPAKRTSPSMEPYKPQTVQTREVPDPADYTSDGRDYKRPVSLSSSVSRAPLWR